MFKVSRGESIDRYYILKLFGYGIFLHKIHHSDPSGIFHNHPWNGISFFLGDYWESKYDPEKGFLTVDRISFFNRIRAKDYHRIIINSPIWTLFFHGPKINEWSVIDSLGNEIKAPWEGEGENRSYSQALNSK